MLSILRIILILSLIAFWRNPFSWVPMIIYIVAVLTDILDGYLARRIEGGATEFGAKLDGFADMILLAVSFFLFVPQMFVFSIIFPLFLGAFLLKMISVLIGFIKFRQITTTHTIANKFFWVLYFLSPIIYFFSVVVGGADIYTGFSIYLLAIFALAVVVTIEEIAILLVLREPDNDIKTFWHIKKQNEKPKVTNV